MDVYDYVVKPPRPVIDETIKRSSKTQQHFRETHNINKIVARMAKRKEVPLNERLAQFGDVSDIGSYQDALIRVQNAQEAFNALPARLKGLCNNDPVVFVEKMSKPDEAWLNAGLENGLYVRTEKGMDGAMGGSQSKDMSEHGNNNGTTEGDPGSKRKDKESEKGN